MLYRLFYLLGIIVTFSGIFTRQNDVFGACA